MYPEFAESFANNLAVTFSMRDEEVTGVDPSVFRRYPREEEEDAVERENENVETETNAVGAYSRSDVRDYKMPRRKTTKRRKSKKASNTERFPFKSTKYLSYSDSQFQWAVGGYSSRNFPD